ncbi:MAG: PAS domain S-box protein [Gammaproteobacteria bacterium]|nr:PAS domain S-box protein [Gammaproteobacteria bacterium]
MRKVAPRDAQGPGLPDAAVSAALHLPLLVLAADLSVRYANPAFCELFGVTASEVEGAPLSALAGGPWDSPALRQGLLDASSGEGGGVDQRLAWTHPDAGGRSLRLRARRLEGSDGQLLLTIDDVTEGERLQHELAARHEFAEKLIDSLREAVLVLTSQLRVHTANQPFYTLFEVMPAETVGVYVYELGDGQWAIPSLERLLEEILPAERAFDDYIVEQTFPKVGWRRMSLNARRLDHEPLILLTIRDLTGDVLGQQRLAASEERFRVLVESTSQAVWETDAAGRVVVDSPSWHAFTGQGPEEWHGDGWLEMIHPDDRDHAAAQWRAALAAGRPLDVEYRLRGAGGEWYWSNARATPLGDGQGHIRGWLGMNLDITARKATEAALRKSEARFRVMADGLPLMIWVHDAAGRLEFVNRTYLEFFGTTAADVAGDGWRLLMHPDDGGAYCDALMSCTREEQPFHGEARVRDATGEWRWLESWGSPRFSAGGSFQGMVGTSADITERKGMQQELLDMKAALEERVAERTASLVQERSFRDSILDTASALIVTVDPAGRVVDFNRACEEMTGYDAAGVAAGMAVMDLVPARERQRVRRIHERVWAGEPRVGVEHGWCRRDGTCFPVSWNYTLLRAADGSPQYIIGSGVDFSEQRAAEEQARRHLEEAARLLRMHTVTQVATVVAHELNQPLGAIAMFADSSRALLERAPEERVRLLRNLERISGQALRGGEIIQRLRSLIKQGRIEPQPMDVNIGVRDVCTLLAGKADDFGISIDMELAADLPPLRGWPCISNRWSSI